MPQRTVYIKMKVLSFSQPHVAPNLNDLLLFCEAIEIVCQISDSKSSYVNISLLTRYIWIWLRFKCLCAYFCLVHWFISGLHHTLQFDRNLISDKKWIIWVHANVLTCTVIYLSEKAKSYGFRITWWGWINNQHIFWNLGWTIPWNTFRVSMTDSSSNLKADCSWWYWGECDLTLHSNCRCVTRPDWHHWVLPLNFSIPAGSLLV